MASKNEIQEEAERKALEMAPINYRPIDSKKKYNRLEFLVAQNDVNDLAKWQEQIKKDPHDPKPREKVYGKLYGNPTMHVGESPEKVRKNVKLAYDEGNGKMARYVETNLTDFLRLFEGDSLVGLLMSMPLYKTGKKEHDKVVSAINHMKKMSNLAKEGEVDKIREIVKKSIKERNIPDWARKAADYFANDDKYVSFLFRGDLTRANYNLAKMIKPDGKVDESKLKKVIKDSIKKAKDEYDDEDDRGRKGDVWDDDVEPCYTTIAKMAYPLAAEQHVKSTGRDDEGREAYELQHREQERKDLGMAA